MNKYSQTKYDRRRSKGDRRRPVRPPRKKWVIMGLLILSIFLIQFFRLKNNHLPWKGPVETTLYATLERDGAVRTLAFLPEGKLVITKSFEGQECVLLAEYTGTLGAPLVGHFFHIQIENRWNWRQKYRNVEKGFIPVVLSVTPKKGEGEICSSLPSVGRVWPYYTEVGEYQLKLDGLTFIKLLDPGIAGLNQEQILKYYHSEELMH